MNSALYVNLPVKDIKKSIEFFTKLGFEFNLQFSNEDAACMIVGSESFVMLLTEKFFKTFTSKEIADAKKTTEVLLAVAMDRKEEVNDLVNKALSMGCEEARETQDYGFMYGRSFSDLDGHIWEIMWMDPTTMRKEKL